MEGKHLTGSIKEAEAFAAMLYPVEPYKIVKVSISRRRSMGFFELGNMDNCGRVWFAGKKPANERSSVLSVLRMVFGLMKQVK